MENMEEDIQVKECKKFIGAKVIAGYWIVIAGYWIAKQKTRITTQRLWKSSETNPHQGLWKYSENPFQWHPIEELCNWMLQNCTRKNLTFNEIAKILTFLASRSETLKSVVCLLYDKSKHCTSLD